MPRYLDPKNDLTFKKIFGEHPDLLISFLNALMPLPPGRMIESVEYLQYELVPDTPLRKDSIVDVRCMDNHGRQFIVEMQMYWSELFSHRMVFNASKAYVRQVGRGEDYELLQPVYGLGIINENFDHKTSEFYHHYQTVNKYNTDEVIPGLEFVLVELKKFRPEKWTDRKMAVLWLRFLKEIKDQTVDVSPDLMENAEIRKALDLCMESAFTPGEMEAYDRYWDIISTEKGLISSAKKAREKGYEEGKEKGIEEGREEGLKEGLKKGLKEGLKEGIEKGKEEGLKEGLKEGVEKSMAEVIINGSKTGLSVDMLHTLTGLSHEKINDILQKHGLH